jgi:hypothetical protein
MMTRSKTANAANAANAAKAIANAAKAIANEPKETEAVESNMDDKTVVYPSMFDRWREPW